jgi:hypothetical protein
MSLGDQFSDSKGLDSTIGRLFPALVREFPISGCAIPPR